MEIDDFTSLNLHDSDLISCTIRTADEADQNIVLQLDYVTDYTSYERTPRCLVFEKCWKAVLRVDFRVLGADPILSAREMVNSELLNEVKTTWAGAGVVPGPKLRHFEIKTSLTGSCLEIVAEGVKLFDDGSRL